ncbi:MAG: response regulator [Candidatus Omnitrophota bacterium]|nr:response regulator [Candidatus Omnitrophota bacterium]MBA3066154.1 response regulator [bacterium]MBU2529258.1 response regulator [bacterium]MBU3930229.1 response regulator [bacterium]MBU4122105.1 response regulator [bacterium]
MKKILIIEDNADSREIFRTVLEMADYEVTEAVDGEDALKKIDESEYSVILVDLSLPKISGWDLIEIIKGKYPSTPLIAATAHAMSGDRDRALKAGCDDYISKPLKPSDLVKKVGKYTER